MSGIDKFTLGLIIGGIFWILLDIRAELRKLNKSIGGQGTR